MNNRTEVAMTDSLLTRSAATDAPVLDVLAERWSPRAFAADDMVDDAQLASALEAARWAPSANNTQPWRFVVAHRGSNAHARIHQALMGFNQAWAGNAAVLIVAVAETVTAEGRTLHYAPYDLGQAVAHLSVQAHHDGLHVHQMGGFDRDAVRAAFDLEDRLEPITVIALGPIGDASDLPEALQERENAPRFRRPLSELILAS
jgi:nitroreductase